jgi:hypothetical protein
MSVLKTVFFAAQTSLLQAGSKTFLIKYFFYQSVNEMEIFPFCFQPAP